MQPGVLSIKRLCLSVVALCLLATAPAQTMQQRLLEALDKLPHPNSSADFQPAAGLPCLNQGKTLVCWSFATCAFLESIVTVLSTLIAITHLARNIRSDPRDD